MRSMFALAIVALLVAPAWAEDAAPPPPPAAPVAPEEPQPPPPPTTPAEPAVDAPAGPEVHKVYVPYRDLQRVFEKEGQGVFVPYAEFRSLWAKAYRMPDDPTKPPVPAALRAASYEGVVTGDAIRFAAQVEVEVLAKGWQRVPMNFGGVGIESATVGGSPALLVPTPKGYDFVVQGPVQAKVDLVLRATAPAKGDTHSVEISVPPVPLARLSLRVPGADTEVQATPRLAGSTGPAADGTTELLAYLGPVSRVQLSWRRRPEEAKKVDPLVFAAEATDVLVDRGVVRTEFRATLSVLRAPLEALALSVPADAVVLFVDGPGIRAWERSAAGDRIQVALREPVKEKWSLHVGLERPVGSLPAQVAVPLVGVERVERETGFVRLRPAEGVKADPIATPGLVQTDLADLPEGFGGQGRGPAAPGKAFAWRHAGRPGGLSVAVEALVPRVSVALANRVGLKPEGVEVRAIAAMTVERAGVFSASFEVPAALEVTQVVVQGAEMDDWTKAAPEGGKAVLRVAFRDRLLGAATVVVHGRLPLAVSDEEGRETPVSVPLVRVLDAQHVRGFLAVHADPALDRRDTAREGLTPLDADAPAAVEPPPLPDAALPLVARFEHREGPASLALAVKRKAATVTGFVETAVRLEPDRTRVEARLVWLVQFRGVDTFRFRGPADLAKRVHLAPRQPGMDLLDPMPEAKPDGAPADWKPASFVWTLRLAAPREGRVDAVLAVDDQPETPLAAGASRRVVLPVFAPVGEDLAPLANTTMHAAVRRDPLLEVATEKVERGEEIDARELEGATQLAAPDTFLAFRSYDPEHAVSLVVTKHEYEPVAEVVVSHMHLNTVLPPEGRATSEAYLVVRNNDRQYLELRLPPGANIRAVSVDGKAETPRRGDDGVVRVPLLSGLRKDQAFLVALVYDHDVERSGLLFKTVAVESPVPLRVTGDLLTWRVHAPADREYTAFGGTVERVERHRSWAFDLLEDLTGLMRRRPAGDAIDLTRVVADLEGRTPFQTQADGVAFLFSNRTGTGTVTLTSASPGAFLFLRVLLLALGFLGARALARLAARRGVGPLVAFLVPAVLLLVLLVPAGPGFSAVLTALLGGVALSGILSLALGVVRAMRRPAPPPPAAPPAAPEGGAA